MNISETSPLNKSTGAGKIFLIAGVILILICLVYLPVFQLGFTNYDDQRYVFENQYIKFSGDNLKEVFTTFFDGHYHPLTLISLMLDHSISGFNPEAFHITSFIRHLISVVLLFFLVFSIFRNIRMAFLVALLFGISPMGVESVAWISERKNVLYTVFFLASLLLYVLFLRKEKKIFYFISLLMFLLSCLSKAQAIILPVVLILIDYLMLDEPFRRKHLLNKIPFLLIAIIFAVLANLAQKSFWIDPGGEQYSFFSRMFFASYAFTMYIVKLIIPFKQSAFYPYPVEPGEQMPFVIYLYIIPVLVYLGLCLYSFKKNKVVFFSLCFFAINIFFLLKLFDVPYGDYIMADRYSYLASTGVFLLVAYGMVSFINRYQKWKYLVYGILCLYFILLGIKTNRQIRTWENGITLWSNVVQFFPDLYQAWNDLGNAKSNNLDYMGAMQAYNKAVMIDPGKSIAFNNRGNLKAKQGHFDPALDDFNEAIRLDPNYADAYNNRGLTYEKTGQLDKALMDFEKVSALRPEFVLAINNKANVYRKLGRPHDAIATFNKAIELNPDFYFAYANRGNTYFETANMEKALRDYSKAIELGMTHPDIYLKKGICLYNLKQFSDAIPDLTSCIDMHPDNAEAYNYRGFSYYNLGKYEMAIRDLDYAIRLNPDNALSYGMRGMAEIHTGRRIIGCADMKKAYDMGLVNIKEQIRKYCE